MQSNVDLLCNIFKPTHPYDLLNILLLCTMKIFCVHNTFSYLGWLSFHVNTSDFVSGIGLVLGRSVQLLSHVGLFVTPWTVACQVSLSITNSQSLLKLIDSVMSSNHLILCRPLLLPSLFPSINSSVLSFLSEKAMAPRSSTLAWKIPWMEEPGGLQSMGSLRVGHDWATSLSLFTCMHWRRKWQSTPVFLPGESQGWGSLGGLPSMGSHRVGHDWSNLAAAAAAFFIVQLSHPYMTTGKTIALTWRDL